MANMERVEVGLSDLGNVFIFHRTSFTDGESWIVRAGNHDILATADQSRAEAAARAICGDDRLINRLEPETETEGDVPEPEPEYAEPTRATVSKVKGRR